MRQNRSSDHLNSSGSTEDQSSEEHFGNGNADEQEYNQGVENGVAFVEKRSRKFQKGAAGLTSKIEHTRSEEVSFGSNKTQLNYFKVLIFALNFLYFLRRRHIFMQESFEITMRPVKSFA